MFRVLPGRFSRRRIAFLAVPVDMRVALMAAIAPGRTAPMAAGLMEAPDPPTARIAAVVATRHHAAQAATAALAEAQEASVATTVAAVVRRTAAVEASMPAAEDPTSRVAEAIPEADTTKPASPHLMKTPLNRAAFFLA